MAGDYDELKATLTELITNTFAPKPEFTRGLLGDGLGNVTVPNRPDKSYVRFNRGSTEYFEVFNVTVNPVNDWPVLIGELPWLPGLTQVVGTDWAAYEQSGWDDNVGATSPHAPTHEWPDGSPGSDVVNIYTRAIVPLRAYALGSGSTTVYVNSYEYENPNASGTVWPGLPGIDLAPVMSSLSTGTARLMGIYLDPATNTLGIITGVSDIFTDASDPPSPQFPPGVLPAGRIRVYGGQANIGEADIRDARRLFGYIPTGTSSAASGGYPFGIITVDPDDTDADYSTLAAAASAATAGQTIRFNGTYTITGSSLAVSKAVDFEGVNPETSIITSALAGDETVDVTAAATFRNCTIRNTASSGSVNRAIKTSAAGIVLENVVLETNGTSSSFALGAYISNGSDVRLTNCRATASGGSSGDFALYVERVSGSIVALVEGGRYEGTSGTDIRGTGSNVTITLVNPHCATGGISVVNSATVEGSFLDAKGRDAGVVVVNSSGSTVAPGDVGYLDEAGEFQTTTTANDTVDWVISNSNSDDGNLMFVKQRGGATVNYTGSAPNAGDFLVTSTSAGDAQAQSTMRPEIFAVCTAAGSGGKVEVLLLKRTQPLVLFPDKRLYTSTVGHSGTLFTGTINGAPSGTSVVYSLSAGNEEILKPLATDYIGKLIIHNINRSNFARISDVDLGTNTITVTDSADISDWEDADSLTIQSQTNTDTTGGFVYVDIELSGASTPGLPALTRSIGVSLVILDSGAAGATTETRLHPFESFADSKRLSFRSLVAGEGTPGYVELPVIDNKITFLSRSSGTTTKTDNLATIMYVNVAAP